MLKLKIPYTTVILTILILFVVSRLIFNTDVFSVKYNYTENKEYLTNSDYLNYKDGKLVYREYSHLGDKIMDFSNVGYLSGTKSIPNIPVIIALRPSGKDDTDLIQNAIDKLSETPLNNNGYRGAILLNGSFRINGTINITVSGIVLRGAKGSSIYAPGTPYRSIINVSNSEKMVISKNIYNITDCYLPVGSNDITLNNTSGLAIGMDILISKTVSEEWVRSLKMDKLVRNGTKQTWIAPGRVLSHERKISKINGNTISLNIPLSDSMDTQFFTNNSIKPFTFSRIYNIGFENLSISTDKYKGELVKFVNGNITFNGNTVITMSGCMDSWITNCTFKDIPNGISIKSSVKRLTISNVSFTRHAQMGGGAKPFDISLEGTQVLIKDCKSVGNNNFSVGTGSTVPGPNVVSGYSQTGNAVSLQPHHRWATGLLVENVTGGDISLVNRNILGSGHGWTVANSVVLNSKPHTMKVQSPPGYKNFEIKDPSIYSLYKIQLSERKDILPIILGK